MVWAGVAGQKGREHERSGKRSFAIAGIAAYGAGVFRTGPDAGTIGPHSGGDGFLPAGAATRAGLHRGAESRGCSTAGGSSLTTWIVCAASLARTINGR